MISPKVSSIAAVAALVLSMAAPTASFAQGPPGRGAGGGGGVHVGGGGGGFRAGGGGPIGRFGGGGGGPPVAHFGGGGGDGWHGGYGGGHHFGGGGGFIPGAIAGAVIGGALASPGYSYYGGPGYYYAPGYYGDTYYDEGPVVIVPAPGDDDAVAYCKQTYRSYDPRSGTYLGYDGYRHPCP